jgi:DNA (cytosine-5)-methyltransferase 1
MNAISLFSNCGAGDLGFKQAGFNFKILSEIEEKRLKVAKLNHPRALTILGDLTSTWKDVISTYNENFMGEPLKLLTACPPCQGFSSARGLRGKKFDAKSGMFDERNLLMTVIPKVALSLNPSVIVIENVPAFLSRKLVNPIDGKDISGAKFLEESLKEHYQMFPILSDLADFGIPQTRKRSVIVFVSKNEINILNHLSAIKSIPFPLPSHIKGKKKPISVREAFMEKEIPSLNCENKSDVARHDFHYLHEVRILDELYIKMISAIPPNSGKSAWKNNTCIKCNHQNESEDVRCQICTSLLPKPIVKVDDDYRLVTGFGTSYKRMDSLKPASTVLTASGSISSHNTIHPYENRMLSPYECQLLQTFPDDFKWGDTKQKYGLLQIRKMIGEAVPPKFTRLHGRILYSLLIGNLRGRMMKFDDIRTVKAKKYINQ